MKAPSAQFYHSFLPAVLLIALSGSIQPAPSASTATHLEELSGKRIQFTQLIDSLDLVKQELKRNGNPVTEIEQQQLALRDTLERIRTIVSRATAQKNDPPRQIQKKKGKFIQSPRNLFDWIIIIVGIIATFSGVLLVSGIIKGLIASAERKKRNPEPEPLSSTLTEPKHPEKLYPGYTRKQVVAPPPSAHPAGNIQNKPAPSEDLATLRALKKRMNAPPQQEPAAPQPAVDLIQPPTAPEDQIPPHSRLSAVPEQKHGDQNKKATLEEQVIRAAQNGMDIATISKTYHISSDHVALLLKVARNNPKI